MKRVYILILMLVSVVCLQAQRNIRTISLGDGSIAEGILNTSPTRDVQNVDDGVIVTYKFHHAILQKDPLYPTATIVKMNGFGLNSIVREPSTLFRWDTIVLPSEEGSTISVIDSSYIDVPMEIAPARPPLSDKTYEGHTLSNVMPIEAFPGWFPDKIVSETIRETYQDYPLLKVCVNPVCYNYENQTIRFYKKIVYKINYAPTSSTLRKTVRSNSILNNDLFLYNTTLNWNLLQDRMLMSRSQSSECTDDYVIVSVPQYADAVNKFAEWKRVLGHNVHVLINSSWTPTSIKASIKQVYDVNGSNLQYILIIGDHQDVPAEQKVGLVTDYYYGFKNGRTSGLPDFMRGRLSVSNAAEAMTVVNKIIKYEKNPPTTANFYKTGLHSAYFQDEQSLWILSDPKIDSIDERRFVLTSEEIRNSLLNKNYNIHRVYSALRGYDANHVWRYVTPKYWNNGTFSMGGEIPTELQMPNFSWTGNHHNMESVLNGTGAFYILHRDHGAINRWAEPPFTMDHVNNLTNGDKLPVLFDMCCETGVFNDTTCLTEKLLRRENGGCVAIYAATTDSYSGYNDAMVEGMFDAIWPDSNLVHRFTDSTYQYIAPPVPSYRLGQILSQGFARMTETWGSSTATLEMFHCFGDPSMRIYTAKPTQFSNANIRKLGNVIIACSGDTATTISFYDRANGIVKAFIGDSAAYTSSSNDIVVCISAHNKIPYIVNFSEFIQNENITESRIYKGNAIKVGSNVTSTKPTGPVTITGGKTTITSNTVEISGETTIEQGAELEIIQP